MNEAQMQELWDAFEAVDREVGPIAYATGYVPVWQRERLKQAVSSYRAVRDRIANDEQGNSADGKDER